MNEKSTMYKKDVVYSFTINPSDAGQYFKATTIQRFRQFTDYNFKHLNTILLDYCDITVYPEISRQGRIHYHGYIRINDIFNFHLFSLHRLKEVYIYEIDTIDKSTKWSEYIHKDKSVIEPALQALGLPYKVNNKIIKKYLNKDNNKINHIMELYNNLE